MGTLVTVWNFKTNYNNSQCLYKAYTIRLGKIRYTYLHSLEIVYFATREIPLKYSSNTASVTAMTKATIDFPKLFYNRVSKISCSGYKLRQLYCTYPEISGISVLLLLSKRFGLFFYCCISHLQSALATFSSLCHICP